MARSLSNFADNLANEILKIKYKDCGCFLISWNKNYSKRLKKKAFQEHIYVFLTRYQ